MKKLPLIFLLVLICSPFFSQDDYDLISLGYEHHVDTNWQSKAIAVDVSLMHKSSRWYSDYRLSLGVSPKGNFYIHAPVSAVLLAGLIVAASRSSSNDCSGTNEMLNTLVKIPEGVTWQFLDKEKLKAGIFVEGLSMDFRNVRPTWEVDWQPAAGLKTRFYLRNDLFIYLRTSAAYSVRFRAFKPCVWAGLGWNIE
jgi:hypothetical protein